MGILRTGTLQMGTGMYRKTPATDYRLARHPLPWQCRVLTAALCLCGLAGLATAQEPEQPDTLTFNAGLAHTWDSNYDRIPEDDPEQITTANAGVRFNQTLSRQRLSARAAVRRYRHDERAGLDTTTWAGGAGWYGAIGNHIKPSLSWARSERLVDRAEFEGKDVVTEDEVKAGLVIAPGHHWGFPLSVRRREQEHSNDSQEALDFTDEEASAGVRYTSNRGSTIGVNVIGGQREYPSQNRARPEDVPERGDLDYDYTTLEFETNWVVSPKTQLESRLGFFDRDGDANDGTGGYALIEGRWQATYKTGFTGGLQYSEPAIGETSNSPSESQRVYLDVEWQATQKILVSSGYTWVQNEFDASSQRSSRSEQLHILNPLTARYQFSDNLEFRLRTAWLERSSPLDEREFDASMVTLGIDLTL